MHEGLESVISEASGYEWLMRCHVIYRTTGPCSEETPRLCLSRSAYGLLLGNTGERTNNVNMYIFDCRVFKHILAYIVNWRIHVFTILYSSLSPLSITLFC